MRLLPLGLLLAGAIGLLAKGPLARPSTPQDARPGDPRSGLVLLWPEPAANRQSGRSAWPGRFWVANRGARASGPVRLVVRTPLGLAFDGKILDDLPPARSTPAELSLPFSPAVTSVCLEVHPLDPRATRREVAPTLNRICHRPAPLSEPTAARTARPQEEPR